MVRVRLDGNNNLVLTDKNHKGKLTTHYIAIPKGKNRIDFISGHNNHYKYDYKGYIGHGIVIRLDSNGDVMVNFIRGYPTMSIKRWLDGATKKKRN